MDGSVVIATYNRAALLADTLNGLLAQRVSPRIAWEIVVVDNNSRDDTRRVVEACAERSPVPLRYRFEPRQGLSRARNAGIDEAKGAVIAFSDDDISRGPDWVDAVVGAFACSAVDGVGGPILPSWAVPPPAWLLATPSCFGDLALLDRTAPGELSAEHPHAVKIYGGNMAFRRELFQALGGFDPDLGRRGDKLYGGEETSFIRRALSLGRRFFYDPRLVAWHHVPAEKMSKAYFRRLRFDRAEGRALGRARDGLGAVGLPPWACAHAARALGTWLPALLRRRSDAFDRQLDFVEALGFLSGCFQARWRRQAREAS